MTFPDSDHNKPENANICTLPLWVWPQKAWKCKYLYTSSVSVTTKSLKTQIFVHFLCECDHKKLENANICTLPLWVWPQKAWKRKYLYTSSVSVTAKSLKMQIFVHFLCECDHEKLENANICTYPTFSGQLHLRCLGSLKVFTLTLPLSLTLYFSYTHLATPGIFFPFLPPRPCNISHKNSKSTCWSERDDLHFC